jgi:CxxC-x17-CxxC domain-containing protein
MLYGALLLRVLSIKKLRNTEEFLAGLNPRIEKRNMSLADQTLYCRDCNEEFIFTVGEQEFYASRGLTNAPSRCPSCRAARKRANNGGSREYSSGGRGGFREPRTMYTAICASCGNEAQVPFQPRDDRPVYCSNCYQPQSSGRSSDRRSRW